MVKEPEQAYPYFEGVDAEDNDQVAHAFDKAWAVGDIFKITGESPFESPEYFPILNSLVLNKLLDTNLSKYLTRVSENESDCRRRLQLYREELKRLRRSPHIENKEKSIIVSQVLHLLLMGVDPLSNLRDINNTSELPKQAQHEHRSAKYKLLSNWFVARFVLRLDASSEPNTYSVSQRVRGFRKANGEAIYGTPHSRLLDGVSKECIAKFHCSKKRIKLAARLANYALSVHDHVSVFNGEVTEAKSLGGRSLVDIREIILTSPASGEVQRTMAYTRTGEHNEQFFNAEDAAFERLTCNPPGLTTQVANRALDRLTVKRHFDVPFPDSHRRLRDWSRSLYSEINFTSSDEIMS